MIALALLCTAAIGLFIARWLKWHFSGPELNYFKFYICLAYNMLFGVIYLDIVRHDRYLLLFHHPEIIDRYPFVGWAAMALMIAHASSYPTRDKTK